MSNFLLPLATIWSDSEKVIFIQSDSGPSMADWATVLVLFLSVVVATISVWVTVKNSRDQREHQKKSLCPHLTIRSSSVYKDGEPLVWIENNGHGLAVIKDIRYGTPIEGNLDSERFWKHLHEFYSSFRGMFKLFLNPIEMGIAHGKRHVLITGSQIKEYIPFQSDLDELEYQKEEDLRVAGLIKTLEIDVVYVDLWEKEFKATNRKNT